MFKLTRIKKEPNVRRVGNANFTGKIFVVGLSGTGTRSLHRAFQMLGIQSRHYPRTPEDFDDYEALSDIPVTCRYKLLDQLYPGSKFIMTVRDVDTWLMNRKKKPDDREEPSFWIKLNRMSTYDCLYYDEAKLRRAHAKWNDEIAAYFRGRNDDFMTMDILNGDGWEKLCPFIHANLYDQVEFPKVKTVKKK